jgi:ABC-type cobalamin/Fe3+-siderophores transport system ATPase subunit/DNA-binding transcriptional MerR regulator
VFKVDSVEITGFWGVKRAKSAFLQDVNIIIGKNGTGKTTFMNILHGVLAVDMDVLYDNSFHSATIRLVNGKQTRTIRAERKEAQAQFPIIEYHISNRRFVATLLGGDERVLPLAMRRRAQEESLKIKSELGKLVSVASLSVYRIGGDVDPEARGDRNQRRYQSTVDARLTSLMLRLTQYQLELSNQARAISTRLQHDVLSSLLYSPERAKNAGYRLDFDAEAEKLKLISAYRQLGVSGTEITKKIQEHIATVSNTVKAIELISKNPSATNIETSKVEFGALEAYKLTSTVVQMSLEAESKTTAIFSQISLFLKTLTTFIPDKSFLFSAGELVVSNGGTLPLSKLSSGEKQLLILFIESLLQRKEPYIFLADEPELSLHISWQRNIISAIRSINPNAQIIVATHSPEIAGKFRDKILDMEDILRG